jgi:hypothetical protein
MSWQLTEGAECGDVDTVFAQDAFPKVSIGGRKQRIRLVMTLPRDRWVPVDVGQELAASDRLHTLLDPVQKEVLRKLLPTLGQIHDAAHAALVEEDVYDAGHRFEIEALHFCRSGPSDRSVWVTAEVDEAFDVNLAGMGVTVVDGKAQSVYSTRQ